MQRRSAAGRSHALVLLAAEQLADTAAPAWHPVADTVAAAVAHRCPRPRFSRVQSCDEGVHPRAAEALRYLRTLSDTGSGQLFEKV